MIDYSIFGKKLNMESVSKINKYSCKTFNHSIYSINLNSGTTPFILNYAEKLWQSNFYNLITILEVAFRKLKIVITLGWYRPRKDEFEKLDREIKKHILNGGLIYDFFHKAIHKSIDDNDKIHSSIGYDDFQKYVKEIYGITLDELNRDYK